MTNNPSAPPPATPDAPPIKILSNPDRSSTAQGDAHAAAAPRLQQQHPPQPQQGDVRLHRPANAAHQDRRQQKPPGRQYQPQAISLNPNSGVPYGHVPAYLPGSASLVEQLDQRVMVVLRDGKHIIGILSSFDQFSNMVLQEAVERCVYKGLQDGVAYFSDIPLGVYVIRGDSMVLLGEVADVAVGPLMKQVTLEQLEDIQLQDETKTGAVGEPLIWDFDTDLIA